MAAIAQAAADAARSALPRLRQATAVLAEELEARGLPRTTRPVALPDLTPSQPDLSLHARQ